MFGIESAAKTSVEKTFVTDGKSPFEQHRKGVSCDAAQGILKFWGGFTNGNTAAAIPDSTDRPLVAPLIPDIDSDADPVAK